MLAGLVVRLVRAIGLTAVLTASAAALGEASPAAGVVIANTVTASYADTVGATYGAQSNTITTSIASVSSIAVAPKETAIDMTSENFPSGSAVTRMYRITNTGNVADAYVVDAIANPLNTVAAASFVTANGDVPIVLGTTVSPTLQPGESVGVKAVVPTTGAPMNTAWPITLTARSTNKTTANGVVSDQGKMWAVAQPPASIAGPSGPNALVTKVVDHVRAHPAAPGETITYQIAFHNYGGSPATNVVVIDDVPAGIHPALASVAINGQNVAAQASLAGQRLTVKAGTMAPGASETLTFDAIVDGALAAGSSYVNVASVSADGIAPVSTEPASVFVGLSNIVYDGYAGASSPVAGATLTLRDATTHAVLALPQTVAPSSAARSPLDNVSSLPTGLAPNVANGNPFVTGADGAYSFVFSKGQLGTQAAPAQYELDITAPNYRERRIAITLSPDASGLLYNATLKQLDDQDLARPGGFELVANSVSLNEVFGLLGNLPVFAPHPLAVSKTVDRDIASGGDRLVYTVSAGGQGASFGATRVVDTLPAGVVYAPGTARVDGVAVEPSRDGRVLTWTFDTLATQHVISYACVVMPYATDGATLVNVVDVDAVSTGGPRVHASASADTRVVAGALSNRIVITGRVFSDVRKTGRFRDGDKGLGGVRVYLEDGSSVTTDQYGRFTFPAVHPGQHVLRVDATTLPAGVHAFDDRRYDSTRSLQRLLHGVFDSGLMQDVEFAVEAAA